MKAPARELGRDVSPTLRLLDDKNSIRLRLQRWRDALLDGAILRNGLFRVTEGRIVLDVAFRPDGRLAHRLGLDQAGHDWLVEINEPRIAGDQNSLTGIGVDLNERAYLLRQGLLRKNRLSGSVSPGEFARRTGLEPVFIENFTTQREHLWFVVAALDEEPSLVRAMTDQFVRVCEFARCPGTSPGLAAVSTYYRLGADEKGGTYVISGRDATEERTILRQQGIVWLDLQKILRNHGLDLLKPRHRLGFEVDGTIELSKNHQLLIEIKTSVSASNIHAGIGQLHLYRKLIKGLAEHKPVLLLPDERLDEDVSTAISDMDIVVYQYRWKEDGAHVEFSDEFKEMCGLH